MRSAGIGASGSAGGGGGSTVALKFEPAWAATSCTRHPAHPLGRDHSSSLRLSNTTSVSSIPSRTAVTPSFDTLPPSQVRQLSPMLVRLANRLRTRQVALTPRAGVASIAAVPAGSGVNAMGRFDRSVVIVSGAARGQGLAIAQRFASEGADVAIGDIGTAASGGTEYALSSDSELAAAAKELEAGALGSSLAAATCEAATTSMHSSGRSLMSSACRACW